MNNSKIFFVSAPRGMWCDFIAHEISKDVKFYDLPLVKSSSTNKWNTGTVLPTWSDRITFDLKAAYKPEQATRASNEVYDLLQTYNQRHIIIQSHYCDKHSFLNIPRLKPIRIVSDPFYYPLFFILGLMKACWDATGLCNDKPSLLFLCEYNKLKNPFTFIDVTWQTNFLNPPYQGDYIELDLLEPIEGHTNHWNNTFEVDNGIDVSQFKQKWIKDIELVESKFGKSYNSIVNSDWKKEVKAMTYEVLLPHMDKRLLQHYYS